MQAVHRVRPARRAPGMPRRAVCNKLVVASQESRRAVPVGAPVARGPERHPVPPSTDESDALGGFRSVRLALAQARRGAAAARRQSQQLRERAASASRAAQASRELLESHRQLWAEWHRGWAALRGAPDLAPGARRLLRVCAYCGAAALPGAGADAEWRAVPPPVRDQLRDGTLGLLPSHGACPSCAAAWLDE